MTVSGHVVDHPELTGHIDGVFVASRIDDADASGAGFQAAQAKIALGSGGAGASPHQAQCRRPAAAKRSSPSTG